MDVQIQLRLQSNSKRLSISIPIVRNRDFDRKISSKSFSKSLSKYSHNLFWISRQSKIDSENGSLKFNQDIEKLLESKYIENNFYVDDSLNDDLENLERLSETLEPIQSREQLNPTSCKAFIYFHRQIPNSAPSPRYARAALASPGVYISSSYGSLSQWSKLKLVFTPQLSQDVDSGFTTDCSKLPDWTQPHTTTKESICRDG